MQRQPVVVIGATGQVARALARCGSVGDHPLICRGRPVADVTDPLALQDLFAALAPAAVVNASAYTAVDRAELDRAAAFAANAEGPEHLARLCRNYQYPACPPLDRLRVRRHEPRALLRGRRHCSASIYGTSKAAGEAAIRQTWPRHLILRTAWVYSLDGQNFLKTMLRLAAERDELAVVDDQHGTPTWADDVAAAIVRILPSLLSDDGTVPWGTYHLTSRGATTWFGFASEIFLLADKSGRKTPRLKPITTADYPTPARRPVYSVLDSSKIERAFGVRLPEWQLSLRDCLAGLDKGP